MITLVHLYPRELGINGDVGNVMALAKRAEWRGMPLEVVNHEVGAELPNAAHLVHIGSGPVSGQDLVRDDLARIGARLREWAAADVPFLAIAGGWQLLGQSLTGLDGTVMSGIGIFPSTAVLTTRRAVGEVVAMSSIGEIAGFENQGAETTLLDGASPLAETIRGLGNRGLGNRGRGGTERGTARRAVEGVVFGTSVGTNLHGPFLPMNPAWADRFLEHAAALAGVATGEPDDNIARVDLRAANSRAAVRGRLGLS